jgi:hypothetical protein
LVAAHGYALERESPEPAVSWLADRWTWAGPALKPPAVGEPLPVCESVAGAHHGLGSAAPSPASSSSSPASERWSTNDGRIGFAAAIGRISGAAEVCTVAAVDVGPLPVREDDAELPALAADAE